jgi:PRTRC genetic system protein A
MSNNNDQHDLFSYFGGSDAFVAPSEPAKPLAKQKEPVIDTNSNSVPNTETLTKTDESDNCDTKIDDNKVVHLASKRLREKRNNESPEDSCDDSKEGDDQIEEQEDELDDDEREALEEDVDLDDAVANKAELAGRQANSEVKADDKSAVTAAATGKKEEKKPVFNHATYIAYAGHGLSITKFFSEESLATLDLEAVRKRLEKDFPELSKQRTKMEYDEKKNIICPMVTGGKKGAYFSQGLKGFFFRSKDLFEKKEPINILAARDGYYEVRENTIGVFVSKVPVVEELEPCREGFKLSLPKIPETLFAQLVSFFADYAMNEVEVMGVFYWDSENEIYVLDVPFQEVSKVKIDACYSQFPQHVIKVAEIHSHNTMKAYFSEVDNEDELGTMLYGVVGRLQKGIREITYDLRTRAGVAGRFIPLESNVIIEGDYPQHAVKSLFPVEYPESWHDRVQIIRSQRSIKAEAIKND